MKRLVQHLPEIRSKNKKLKSLAINMLNNIKIWIFIKKEEVNNYYDKINNKYYKKFPQFLKYFQKKFY